MLMKMQEFLMKHQKHIVLIPAYIIFVFLFDLVMGIGIGHNRMIKDRFK